ncbi:M15 family metallopeptidase [Shewanella gelidii]|uniref:Peptidase M15 n=1 Tax=Shewanella gelidii TaxID=1642821 RepID=A0A917NBX1_9GAMM|nr:M15 family metallopeptidase [Shewanella gelidii]MCL1098582.1 M15 family metallopeptidase [Shewanella gelidii]GGI86918.1 peptidase M15 [Shewanella gelidii]
MSGNAIKNSYLYGIQPHQLIDCAGVQLQQDTAAAFTAMQRQAQLEGIHIEICSAHRTFVKQAQIFNAKANGIRPLLDIECRPLDSKSLNQDELLHAILNWSALPGGSRHHWGTDIDVFDTNRIKQKDLKLVAAEYEATGPCGKLSSWLKEHAPQYGFFFPYQKGKSGVSPEPWHLSYAPISARYLELFDPKALQDIIYHSDISLKKSILDHLPYLVEKYVYRIADIDSQVR